MIWIWLWRLWARFVAWVIGEDNDDVVEDPMAGFYAD